jgi:hypothetical protein
MERVHHADTKFARDDPDPERCGDSPIVPSQFAKIVERHDRPPVTRTLRLRLPFTGLNGFAQLAQRRLIAPADKPVLTQNV